MFFIGSCCVFLLLLFYFFLVLAHFYALPLLESFSLFYFHSCIYLYIELAALYSLALYLYLPLFVFVKYAMAYTQHLKERIKRLKPYYFALLSYAYLGLCWIEKRVFIGVEMDWGDSLGGEKEILNVGIG